MNFPDKEALASVLESSRVGAGIIVRPHELGIIPGDDPVNRAHFIIEPIILLCQRTAGKPSCNISVSRLLF